MKQSTAISFAVCGALAILASGCMQKPKCEELGTCGGPKPVGTWVLSPGYGSCSEQVYFQETDPRLAAADVPAARIAAPEPALWDWCDGLVTNGGKNIQKRAGSFIFADPQVGSATVRLNDDGTFSAGITKTGTYALDFPAICVRAFGAMDDRPLNPDDPNSGTGKICDQLQVQMRASGLGSGAYPNTTCISNPKDPAGCVCYFDVTATGGPTGYYRMLDSSTIMFIPQTNLPQKANYCNKGDSLQLTGADGEYLFGIYGLRTFNLSKVVANCTDGQQGPGELGIDCGGDCPNACPEMPAMPATQ